MQRVVAAQQRLVEHLGELLGRHGLAAPAAGARAVALHLLLLLELLEQLGQRVLVALADRGTARPRSEKYTSNTVSKARQWAWFFTSVAASAYLNASRSSSGMCLTASMASRFSVRLTGRPASRSSWMNPASSSVIAWPAASSGSTVGHALLAGRGLVDLARAPGRARAPPWRCRSGT